MRSSNPIWNDSHEWKVTCARSADDYVLIQCFEDRYDPPLWHLASPERKEKNHTHTYKRSTCSASDMFRSYSSDALRRLFGPDFRGECRVPLDATHTVRASRTPCYPYCAQGGSEIAMELQPRPSKQDSVSGTVTVRVVLYT